jgi:hypothetical protein
VSQQFIRVRLAKTKPLTPEFAKAKHEDAERVPVGEEEIFFASFSMTSSG